MTLLRPRVVHAAAGIGLDDTGIYGKALTANQPGLHASAHHALEHGAQNVAVAEPSVPVDREGRMIGNRILKPEATEPPVSQIKLYLLTQPTVGADRIAVADQQHPDHQFGINRRAARMAVKRRKFGTQPVQIKHRVDPTQQVTEERDILKKATAYFARDAK